VKFQPQSIPDVILIEAQLFPDDRGHFYEAYHIEKFKDGGIDQRFVQDNSSLSQQGSLRGLHYQLAPYEQGKLVRVREGEIFDVAVDIRTESSTFGKWVGIHLKSDQYQCVYVPPGFAHGFLVLSPQAIVDYKCTQVYSKESERGILWSDPEIGIEWPTNKITPILSEKDAQAPLLSQPERQITNND